MSDNRLAVVRDDANGRRRGHRLQVVAMRREAAIARPA